MPQAPLLALLTDFGVADTSVGIMKAVILGIAPGMPLVDLTHAIPPQDVRAGGWALRRAWRWLPEGAVVVGVVDPGVGSARRALAARIGGRAFVGPDNGLVSALAAETPIEQAVTLDDPRWQLPQPSFTFHGRDIFAPCAAHLARGIALDQLGSPLAPDVLVRIALPQPRWEGDTLVASVAHVDIFGNLITDVEGELAERVLTAPEAVARIGGAEVVAKARTFAGGPAGEPFLLRDSAGCLMISVRDGSAARTLGVGRDAPLHIERLAPQP